MAWHKLKPQNTSGGPACAGTHADRRKRALLTARLDDAGQFSMSHAVADLLGNPNHVLVEVEPLLSQIRLTPTTNEGGFALSGGGNASHRIRMRDAVTRWPELTGHYQPRKYANAVLFMQEGAL